MWLIYGNWSQITVKRNYNTTVVAYTFLIGMLFSGLSLTLKIVAYMRSWGGTHTFLRLQHLNELCTTLTKMKFDS